MTVRLNEGALRQLLESENGPVGRDLQRRAENITAQATENASGEFIGILSGDLHSGIAYRIEQDAQGLKAIIGTNAQHRGFFYPAWHDQHGRPWLTSALEAGRE